MSDEVLLDALAALSAPPLPEAVAERVGRLARAHLAPPPDPAPGLRVPTLRLREALVPALLMSAAAVRTADTVQIAREVFGAPAAADRADEGRGPPER